MASLFNGQSGGRNSVFTRKSRQHGQQKVVNKKSSSTKSRQQKVVNKKSSTKSRRQQKVVVNKKSSTKSCQHVQNTVLNIETLNTHIKYFVHTEVLAPSVQQLTPDGLFVQWAEW